MSSAHPVRDSPGDMPATLPAVVTRDYTLHSRRLTIAEFDGSAAADGVANEIAAQHGEVTSIAFEDGDTVLDIGAHVGVVSIWLAKLFPAVRIIALEPMPEVFGLLVRNLAANAVGNVLPLNLAVTGDGRPVHLVSNPWTNSGGSTAQLRNMSLPGHLHRRCPSVTLDELFDRFAIETCPLLKIDCEGSEYEILHASDRLGRIDHVRGEFHENDFLRDKGYSAQRLARYLAARVRGTVTYTYCEMANL